MHGYEQEMDMDRNEYAPHCTTICEWLKYARKRRIFKPPPRNVFQEKIRFQAGKGEDRYHARSVKPLRSTCMAKDMRMNGKGHGYGLAYRPVRTQDPHLTFCHHFFFILLRALLLLIGNRKPLKHRVLHTLFAVFISFCVIVFFLILQIFQVVCLLCMCFLSCLYFFFELLSKALRGQQQEQKQGKQPSRLANNNNNNRLTPPPFRTKFSRGTFIHHPDHGVA